MAKAVLIRYGELSLKGKNRANFENRLMGNIKQTLKCGVKRTSGRLLVYPENIKDAGKLKKVFGISSISIAEGIGLDIEKMKEEALKQAKAKKFSTFRITVQRLQKRLRPSPELEKEIGAFIVERMGRKVKLKQPELEISVEIAENAYVFTERIKCFGGLPTGIEGNVAVLFDKRIGDEKSALAGLLMMRRGCDVYPYAYGKTDAKLLGRYGAKETEVVKNMKELEKDAMKKNCKALVVGQTFRDFAEIDTGLVVLRPLIGFDEKEIRERLGEFEKVKG